MIRCEKNLYSQRLAEAATAATQMLQAVTCRVCASQSRVVFDNVLVVVTRDRFQDDVLLDGQRLTTWTTFRGYAVGRTSLSHGLHFLQVMPGSAATFAAYVYGHSILDTSSSGYGYTVTYQGRSTSARTTLVTFSVYIATAFTYMSDVVREIPGFDLTSFIVFLPRLA